MNSVSPTTNPNPNIAPVNPALVGTKPVPMVAKIVTIEPKRGLAGDNKPDKNLPQIAKGIEPGLRMFIDVVNSSEIQIVEIIAEASLDDSEMAKKLSQKVGFTETSVDALAASGSRIMAKRCPDSEVMDWAVISAALGQNMLSLGMVIKELTAIRKLKQKQAELNKKS